MTFSVDDSELRAVGVNMGKIASGLLPDVDAVVKRGAHNIKEDLVAGAKGSPHFKGVAPAISYDSKYGIGSVGYEIGPEIGRAGGSLGHIYYFGDSRGGGGSGDLEGPMNREAPELAKHLGDLLGDLGGRL